MPSSRLGIWLIGARGGVGTCVAVGLAALRQGQSREFGLVSALPEFADLEFAAWDAIVLAGHDVRQTSLTEEAERLAAESRLFDAHLLAACRDELAATDARIRPGTLWNVGPAVADLADAGIPQDKTPRAALARIGQDLAEFKEREQLDRIVVVNVASTEPATAADGLPHKWEDLEALLDSPACPLRASTLYAIAALTAGHGYLNFTPSLGSHLPALNELAAKHEACHMGCDGKTGETLMKSVLAPMFAQRNLNVMSWVGHNIFGNRDAQILDDPANKQTKVASKDKLVHQILGYTPQTLVTIERIDSMGDWKTAWDHIHFQGFLGTPMTLQFTWQGTDSLLAAPLVLDMARFAERAARAGESGMLTFLASFFKSPHGIEENDFTRQFQMLQAWAEELRSEGV